MLAAASRRLVRQCRAASRTVTEAWTGPPHEVKGSVFVGYVIPAEGVQEARAEAKAIKNRHRLTHGCWAYRGYGFDERSNDDGEPKGTAGEPILREMAKVDLRNAAVIVTREYGGVKLGTGGLVHAYGAAARLAIEAAEMEELEEGDPRF